MSWLNRITLVIALAFVFLGAAPAQAFDKAKFSGVIVLYCNIIDPPMDFYEHDFSLDFATMKSDEKGIAADKYILRWVGNGPSINLFALWNQGPVPLYQVNLDTGIISELDALTGAVKGVWAPKPCHDDGGLVPAPGYTDAGRAQIEAEARPSIDDAKVAAKKLSPAQKKQAQAKFVQAFDLFKAGDFDAAILGFKQGLDIDPSSGLANFYLGESYTRTNRDYLAKVRWQRTIDPAPSSKEALQAQVRLTKP